MVNRAHAASAMERKVVMGPVDDGVAGKTRLEARTRGRGGAVGDCNDCMVIGGLHSTTTTSISFVHNAGVIKYLEGETPSYMHLVKEEGGEDSIIQTRCSEVGRRLAVSPVRVLSDCSRRKSHSLIGRGLDQESEPR